MGLFLNSVRNHILPSSSFTRGRGVILDFVTQGAVSLCPGLESVDPSGQKSRVMKFCQQPATSCQPLFINCKHLFYHLFVRNGAKGKPSLLKTSGIEVSSKQKRAATGVFTSLEEMITVFPSILAVASTNF
jgi:hypothetical protein